MDNILTKKIQTQFSDYFSSVTEMTKPETRCLKDMVLGILKSKLKDVCKRLSAQYLKEDYAEDVRSQHLKTVAGSISKDNFILMDGTDIRKKHAKFMEGLEFVKNGDGSDIGLGYNVLNINAISNYKEITPLYSKAYSFEMGALSSNNEIKKAVREVKDHIKDKGCWVFDRGADSGILKDFFVSECSEVIIRLKRSAKVFFKEEEFKVSELGAIPINYTVKGIVHSLWLVVSRNKKHGGLAYLLVKSKLSTAIEVAKWAFRGYGLRWKIEQYHRHVKQEYRLEEIQIKTFDGLQSMLSVLTVAMYMIYKKISSLHFSLLLDAGYNYLNKHTVRELTNFIYYKVSKVVSILLMPTRTRQNIIKTPPDINNGQLNLMFN